MSDGLLTVVVGPMSSGKTAFLIHMLEGMLVEGLKPLVLKPSIDTRQPGIRSRNGKSFDAQGVTPGKMLDFNAINQATTIVIDEVHMFEHDEEILLSINYALNKGKYVVCSGLDLDYKTRPFVLVSKLIAKANTLVRLFARCTECGDNAEFTQRLVDSDELILVGDAEYAPRCRDCYNLPEGVAFSMPE